MIARRRADPQGFLDGLTLPAILDEVQNVPELLNYIRSRIDAKPRRTGQWFITGSQEAPLMRGITESMAGRAAILHLYPLATTESAKVDLLHGGYPEAVARPKSASLWFSSYVQTDNDGTGDYIGWFAGDNGTAANRPQLVVVYQ